MRSSYKIFLSFIILLLYIPLAYLRPEIFLKTNVFILFIVLITLVFIFELNFKEKMVLIISTGILYLFLAEIIPSPFIFLLKTHLALYSVISLGTIITFLIILLIIFLLQFIYNRYFGARK